MMKKVDELMQYYSALKNRIEKLEAELGTIATRVLQSEKVEPFDNIEQLPDSSKTEPTEDDIEGLRSKAEIGDFELTHKDGTKWVYWTDETKKLFKGNIENDVFYDLDPPGKVWMKHFWRWSEGWTKPVQAIYRKYWLREPVSTEAREQLEPVMERKKLKLWLRKCRILKKNSDICRCPVCRNILNDNSKREIDPINPEYIAFDCYECNNRSLWRFVDIPEISKRPTALLAIQHYIGRDEDDLFIIECPCGTIFHSESPAPMYCDRCQKKY